MGATTGLALAIGLAASAACAADRQAVRWNSGESDIVVRYEASERRAARVGTWIPTWTLYGDGLVVWTDQDADPVTGCALAVWTGRLDTATIEELLTTAEDQEFFELAERYEPWTAQLATPDESEPMDPVPLPLDTPAETLSISLLDRHQRVRVRPAGWPGAPAAFRGLRDQVLSLEPNQAQRFVPQRYRLRVIPAAGGSREAERALPSSLAGLALAAVSMPLELGRAEGEELAEWFERFGSTVEQEGREFQLQLFAVPPRER